jgi:type III pantothenate kinase
MILAISSGNEYTAVGGYDGDGKLAFTADFVTPAAITADEYTIKLKGLIALKAPENAVFDGAAVADVSDIGAGVIKTALKNIVTGRIITIGPGVKTGLNIRIDDPAVLGANLVADAAGAVSKYGYPVVIADLGTATVFTVVDAHGVLRGGAIIPGFNMSLRALSDNAASLPRIQASADKTYSVLGTNTAACMKSGIVFAAAAVLDGFLARYKTIIGEAPLIVTGAYAEIGAKYCESPVIIDKTLTLKGLYEIYKKQTS